MIAFDASSDVQTGSALQRIQHFADDCGLTLSMRPDPTPTPTPMPTSDEQNSDSDLDIKFHGRYAQILDAHREDGTHVRLIYCPMLPNAIEPDFDPSVSAFFHKGRRSLLAHPPVPENRHRHSATRTTWYGLGRRSPLQCACQPPTCPGTRSTPSAKPCGKCMRPSAQPGLGRSLSLSLSLGLGLRDDS